MLHMPQGFYLNQVNPISVGECAALSNAMAYAIQEGKQHILIENFYTTVAHPEHVNTQKFKQNLTNFQATLRTDFHGGQTPTRQLTQKSLQIWPMREHQGAY